MDKLKLMLLASAVVVASGCGGTSGGSSDEGNNLTPNPTPTPSPEVTSTAELQTTAEFEFSSTEALTLDLDIVRLASERGYLYVCQKKDANTLNYDRCLVKTPISNGQYDGTFTLGNDIETLGLEVWTYDPADEPDSYSWARSKDGMTWTVTDQSPS